MSFFTSEVIAMLRNHRIAYMYTLMVHGDVFVTYT